MTICVTGINSTVAQEFSKIVRETRTFAKPAEPIVPARTDEPDFPLHHDRYLFCQGLLYSKPESQQTIREINQSIDVNFAHIGNYCDAILDRNKTARICIITSESGFRGSYDETYARAKRLMNLYIAHTPIKHPGQQLVGIAPSIIEDSGMTRRRTDEKNLRTRRETHPKGRFATAREVAEMAHILLFKQDYVCNTIIRMHGGWLMT